METPKLRAVRDLPASARRVSQQGSTFYVIGDQRARLRDAYHLFLRMPWWASFGVIAAGFMAVNLGFAAVFYAVGGVKGSDGTYFDALSFSVQTLATIGYGAMYPEGVGAEITMMIESIVSLVLTALATGLVFSKFARPATRVAFSRHAVITQHEGQRTLIFRAGNRRSHVIVEATIHAVHAIHKYTDDQIRVDHHFEDTLIALDSGEFVVDMTRFDAVAPDPAARDSVRP
jgi:inward rectifier potassium channel